MDYELKLQRFYEGLLQPGMVAVDVGAHVGRHAFEMLRLVQPGGFVWMYEPIPALYRQLASKIEADPDLSASVSAQPLAISDVAGTTEFCLAVDAPAYSGLLERQYDTPTRLERIRVEVRRLDDLLPNSRVDYIKIDTEGAEWNVIKGARAVINRHRPVISFEFGENSYRNYGVDPREVFDFFAREDYVIADILGRRLEDRVAFSQSSIRQAVWDYVALPGLRAKALLELLATGASC